MSVTRMDSILALFPELDGAELRGWIAREWVQPEPTGEENWGFDEVDIARVRLIYDLRHQMDVAEDTLPMILSLLDQVYELRSTVKEMRAALDRQPEEVRASLLAIFQRDDGNP